MPDSKCPECGQERIDDDRVKNGMKCAKCAGYYDQKEGKNDN